MKFNLLNVLICQQVSCSHQSSVESCFILPLWPLAHILCANIKCFLIWSNKLLLLYHSLYCTCMALSPSFWVSPFMAAAQYNYNTSTPVCELHNGMPEILVALVTSGAIDHKGHHRGVCCQCCVTEVWSQCCVTEVCSQCCVTEMCFRGGGQRCFTELSIVSDVLLR